MNRKIGVILSYLMMVLEILSTLLLTPFVIRTIGQAEYGVYKLSASITAYLLLLDLGMGNAIIRYVTKYKQAGDEVSSRKFVGIATIFYAIVAVVILVIGLVMYYIFPYVFATGLNHCEIVLGQKLILITMINASVTMATALYPNILIAYEKFALQKGWAIIQILLKILLTYVAVYLGMGSVGIVLVILLLNIITRGLYALYVLFKLKVKPLFKNVKFSFVKEIIIYSSYIFLQMIAIQFNSMVGQVLLGILVPASAVIIGVYGIGMQIIQYFQSIGAAFNNVLTPGVVKMVEGNSSTESLQNEMIKVGRLLFMTLSIIFLCFMIYGKQFITVWVGDENLPAFYVTVILMFAYLFINVGNIGNQILWAKNQHKEQSIIKLIIVLLNIGLTVVLIKWNPLLGVTIGTFVSLVLGDVILMNIIFKKKIGISLSKYYSGLLKGILPSLIIAGGLGYLFSLLKLSGWLGFICNVAFTVIVYGICMLLFGFNKYEKNLVSSLFFKKTFQRK